MKLSDKERIVLACVEHRANEQITVLQKKTKLRIHTIRYCLSSLLRRGAIIGKAPFINLYPLGYTDYTIYFSISTKTKHSIQQLFTLLQSKKSVSWLAQLGGEYQIGIALCAKRVEETAALLDNISSKYGEIFFRKSISVRLGFTAFGRKYLWSRPDAHKELRVYRNSESDYSIDEVDHQILSAMSNRQYESIRDLARLIQIPATTTERRIDRLEEIGVIEGYIYRLRLAQFGAQTYRLLIYTKGLEKGFTGRFYKFCAEHPNILHLFECLGAWDFEVGIEVYSSEAATEVVQDLYQKFSDTLSEVKMLQIFKHLKYSGYPF